MDWKTKPLHLAAFLAVVIILLVLPKVMTDPYRLHMTILVLLSCITGMAWNLLGGFTGQHSIGHAAYFGVGAYTTMILLEKAKVAPWYGVWAGAAAAVLVALVIGLICFRLRGPYFVLASIAVTEIMRLSALNVKEVTNGAEGILMSEMPPFHVGSKMLWDFSNKEPYYYTALGFALFAWLVAFAVKRSKLGYCLQAIREDQDAAHSLGIPLTRYKVYALSLSALMTGLAGGLYGTYVGFVDPGTVLGLDLSVQIALLCIIGGIGTLPGPVLGACLLVPMSEILRSNLATEALLKTGLVSAEGPVGVFLKEHLAHAHVLIYGILVVLVILFMPEGIMGFLKRIFRRKAVA